ncbi:hypothetical protein MKW98_032316 [Papaver atlanticum]|uniref:RRM domain-containing protein n=1 Tax=Papaver atlanticum TaxID=357466 RepID=A0AAD4XEQ1_9MAGN|nr:hypothetical protein MKW98_032316 [Papaver atlanticum]
MSKSSNIVAASHAFVNSGEGNKKRDAEEEEIDQKLNSKKKNKFYVPKSQACSLKAFHDISYDEFITQTVIVAPESIFFINKSHVIDFFENVGDIADVRFSYDEHGTFRGIVHVKFATEEAEKEVVKWNGRDVLWNLALFVKPFVCKIWSFLKKHFRTCRTIVNIDIPKDHTTGVLLGTTLIEFSTLQDFHRALDMDGQEADGTSLTIKDHEKHVKVVLEKIILQEL